MSHATSGNNNRGISFINAADLDAANGPFNVTGTGGNGIDGNVGVYFDTNTTFNGEGSGTLTLIGTGQGSGDNNVGVQMNATTSLTANTGDIDITGRGAVSSGSGNNGVILGGAITVMTSAGNLNINGAVSAGVVGDITGNGSLIHGVGGDVTAANGNIDIAASTGAITQLGGTSCSSGGGDITLGAATSISLGSMDAGNGNLYCTANGGAITDATGSATSQNLVGMAASLSATGGIGTGMSSGPGNIGTDLSVLTAQTTAGDIVVRELGAISLGNITTGALGNFDLDAGGVVSHFGAATLNIGGNLLLTTNRDPSIGTVNLRNSTNTSLDSSLVAGNYTLTTSPSSAIQLLDGLEVGGDMTMTGTTFTENGFKVFAGGDVFFNGLDIDLSGNVIFAKGLSDDFNISFATLASVGDIEINLRGLIENYVNPQFSDAILLNNTGNVITGSIKITTIDPNLTGLMPKDFNLIQTAPITLSATQNLVINAARGSNNLPIGVNNSPGQSHEEISLQPSHRARL